MTEPDRDTRKAAINVEGGTVEMTIAYVQGTDTVVVEENGREAIHCSSLGDVSARDHFAAYAQLQAMITAHRHAEIDAAMAKSRQGSKASDAAAEIRTSNADMDQERANKWFSRVYREQGHPTLVREAVQAAKDRIDALTLDATRFREVGNLDQVRHVNAEIGLIQKYELPVLTRSRAQEFLKGKK